MRRTKATLIYRRTKNLPAIQLLLGHTKLESTVRYLGIEVDDALEISDLVVLCKFIRNQIFQIALRQYTHNG
jgi:integrase